MNAANDRISVDIKRTRASKPSNRGFEAPGRTLDVPPYGVRRQSGAATALLLIVVSTVLTGCKTFRPVEDPTRHYVLSSTASAPAAARSSQGLTIGVAPVELPGYLQSTRIAVRRGTNEIDYSDFRQWAEHLDKGIQRVLASDLSTLLPSARIITSAWQTGDVKAEVHISIQRFELDDSGVATLECEWRILSPGSGRILHLDHASISKKGPPLANNPTAAVHTLSEALTDLSNQIAAALRSLPLAEAGAAGSK